MAEVSLWSMPAGEAGEVLVALTRARAQVDELLMRVLRHAETAGTGSDSGAVTAVSWWAHETNTTRVEAHRTAKLAESLECHESVREALAEGRLVTEQARVVVDAVDALPTAVEAWVPEAAVSYLLEKAGEHDARTLRVIGRRILEVIDPEAADAEEARQLEAEEKDALAAASFTMSDDGHGRCHGRFSVPSLHGEMLRKHLMALASPARDVTGAADPEGAAQPRMLSRHRMGAAFTEYVETRPGGSVPSSGGVPATVVVTMELETLLGGLKAASLDTGGRISAGEARRLACRAGVIPVVLGGRSTVLDVGRKRRFHSEAQRIALGVRDGGCSAYGCETPPGLCHAHHDIPWSRGGGTSVEHGRLLCPRHHRRIHDLAFGHSLDKHGHVRFSRRT